MVRVVGPPKLGSIWIVVLLKECIKHSSLVGYTGACVHSICINELGGVLGNSESWWEGGCPHRHGRRVEIEKWGEIYSNFRCKYVFWRESRVFVFWTELLLGLFFISDCKVHSIRSGNKRRTMQQNQHQRADNKFRFNWQQGHNFACPCHDNYWQQQKWCWSFAPE